MTIVQNIKYITEYWPIDLEEFKNEMFSETL